MGPRALHVPEVLGVAVTLFRKVDYPLSKLVADIRQGEIGLPDIQRPFVWSFAKVRDLFDSMYKGFPVGYLLFWENSAAQGFRQIGGAPHQRPIPRLLIVDGQQRLTSLYAVMTGQPILTEDFTETRIRMAFRPRDRLFEVTDAAIDRDPEFVTDISQLWSGDRGRGRFVDDFTARLRGGREVGEDERYELEEAIDRLYDLQNYPFVALELSADVDEEQVGDVFVRINSQGKTLNQADFILTLLSVFWEDGRAQLERFCKGARTPPAVGARPSPYNHLIRPDPDQMLRVSVGLGFRRARLRHVYSILRGKDLETGELSPERREEQFARLRHAQEKALDLTSWHDFLKALLRAGFRRESMLTSQSAVLYSYVIFLIGKHDVGLDSFRLRDAIARWFFMSSLTRRYTSSPETAMDEDLARLRGVSSPDSFAVLLQHVVGDALTEDYWNIALPNELETSAARSPARYAYEAALNLLDARVLFSSMRVAELMDPALNPKKAAVERHHLFPKAYLAGKGISGIRDTNQVANFAFVEWDDNSHIADSPPSDYWPVYAARCDPQVLQQMMLAHALPDGWHEMPYGQFLAERRRLMAGVIRRGFESLRVAVPGG